MTEEPRALRIATRSSPLAMWQAERVAALLGAHGVDTVLVPMDSLGDRVIDVPLHEVGGQGIFVKEVQAAVVAGDADLAVHSAKDLPSGDAPDGLILVAFPERADPRDCLVGLGLDDLPADGLVATGSVRRRAQLAHIRPGLRFVDLRGNMATRLAKLPAGGSLVAAVAGLSRLGLGDRIAEPLDVRVLLPQVGQGALGVECRAEDRHVMALLAAIDDPVVHVAVVAERAFLARLGSGCDLPVAAYAEVDPADAPGVLRIEGLIASLDGVTVLRHVELAVLPLDPGAEGAVLNADHDAVLAVAEQAGRDLAAVLLAAGGAALLA